MKRFCVKCGKETNELIDSLCQNCFLDKNEPIEIPPKMKLDFDKRSNNIKVGFEWLEKNEDNIGSFVAEKVIKIAKKKGLKLQNLFVDVEEDKSHFKTRVSFDAEIQGVELHFEKEVIVNLNATISDASMKISSNYHEAIIQIRFEDYSEEKAEEKLNEILSLLKIEKKKIELSEAIDVKKARGGYDVFVGSSKAANIVSTSAAKKYNSKVVRSSTLLGIDKTGKEKYRQTFCIRF